MNGWRCNAPRVGGTAGALPPPLPESQPAESQHAMPVDCSGSQTVAVLWAPPRPAAARATTMTTAAKFKARPEPRGSQHGAVLAGGRLMYGLSQGASTAPSQATATRGGGGGQEGGPPRGSLPGPWESFPPPSQSQYGWEEQSGKPGGHLNPQATRPQFPKHAGQRQAEVAFANAYASQPAVGNGRGVQPWHASPPVRTGGTGGSAHNGSLPDSTAATAVTATAAAAARVIATLNSDMAERLQSIEKRCASIESALATLTARDQADAASGDTAKQVLSALQHAVAQLTQLPVAAAAAAAAAAGGGRDAAHHQSEQLPSAKRSRLQPRRGARAAGGDGDAVSGTSGDAANHPAVVVDDVCETAATASALQVHGGVVGNTTCGVANHRFPVWTALAQDMAAEEELDPFACLMQEHQGEVAPFQVTLPPVPAPPAPVVLKSVPILMPPFSTSMQPQQQLTGVGMWRSVRRTPASK